MTDNTALQDLLRDLELAVSEREAFKRKHGERKEYLEGQKQDFEAYVAQIRKQAEERIAGAQRSLDDAVGKLAAIANEEHELEEVISDIRGAIDDFVNNRIWEVVARERS